MARGARTSSSTWKKRPRSPLGGTPHARVGGRNRGPPRDGPGGLGQGDPGVRTSGSEVRLRGSACLVASGPGSHGALALLLALIQRSAWKGDSAKFAYEPAAPVASKHCGRRPPSDTCRPQKNEPTSF